MLKRREAIATLMANRPKELLVVPGLGSTTYDLASLGEKDTDFYLWGAMGGAAMIGLGLALAQPQKRVAVITGDGEMLMGIGALATIGVQQPANFSVVVIDNERYGETGMQATHTAHGIDLAGVARSCKINVVAYKDLPAAIHKKKGPHFAVVKVDAEKIPLVLPPREGTLLKARFRRALLGAKADAE